MNIKCIILISILVHKISKKYKNTLTLQSISFHILKVSLVVLLGPSGSGKSTLLRIIAGLDFPDYGSIWLKGKDTTLIPPQYRQIGFVFQNYGLFYHMNVKDNIIFGVKLRQIPMKNIETRFHYLLDSLRISDIVMQFPSQLSGGQKQRVALARSLIIEPEFLLLDEPFGALDGELRRSVAKWLKQYLKYKNITAIMVTHDQKEAITMADEVLILNNGYLIQQDKPKILYDYPINKFVGIFFGSFVKAPTLRIQNNVNTDLKVATNRLIDDYEFFIRPHEIMLYNTLPKDLNAIENQYLLALVKNIIYKKHFVQLQLEISDLSWNSIIQLGYLAFERLQIRSRHTTLWIKPRAAVLQRAYPKDLF